MQTYEVLNALQLLTVEELDKLIILTVPTVLNVYLMSSLESHVIMVDLCTLKVQFKCNNFEQWVIYKFVSVLLDMENVLTNYRNNLHVACKITE